jgi:hypothetical protein
MGGREIMPEIVKSGENGSSGWRLAAGEKILGVHFLSIPPASSLLPVWFRVLRDRVRSDLVTHNIIGIRKKAFKFRANYRKD